MKTQKLLAMLMAVSMLFSFAACGKTEQPDADSNSGSGVENSATASVWDSAMYTEDTEVGQGEKTVLFTVSAEERQVVLTIKTDADSLGQALIENNLIEGEDGDWGMYVKSVISIRADYDLDGYWWSLEENGNAANYGVDEYELSADTNNVFSFVYTPAY